MWTGEYIKLYSSPIGRLAMITDGEALTALLLEREVRELGIKESGPEGSKKIPAKAGRIFAVTAAWLDDYFAGKEMANPALLEKGKQAVPTYSIKVGTRQILLRPKGTEFRQLVWECLCKIPYGETVTYGDIAKDMAKARGKKKMSAQAVGGAVGHNPISIIIPCHRVIGAGGNLVGYGGGMPVKVQLLRHETQTSLGRETGAEKMKEFIVPTKGTKI